MVRFGLKTGVVASVLALMLAATTALAGTFTKDEANRFLDTLPELKTYGETHQDTTSSLKNLIVSPTLKTTIPEKPYTHAVGTLKTSSPAEYDALTTILKAHNFKSPESWATVGDNVTLAIIANELQKQPQGLVQMGLGMNLDQLPPEAMAFMSPKMLKQLKAAQAIARQSETVPPEDVTTIEPLMAKFKAAIKDDPLVKNLQQSLPAQLMQPTTAPTDTQASTIKTETIETTITTTEAVSPVDNADMDADEDDVFFMDGGTGQ